MDLIERYVQEIGRHLPPNQREDVARELRSSLEDSLESRAGVPLDQVGDDLPVEVLREFGPPRDVAAEYRTGPDYLIGPSVYPVFIRTMKVVLAVGAALVAIGILLDVVGSSGEAEELARIGAKALTNLQIGFLGLLGLVVAVFAIIERRSASPDASSKVWDPHDLPSLTDDRDEVDRGGTVVGLILGAVALLVINVWPDLLRIHVWSDGDQFSVPVLGSDLRSEMRIFSIYLALGLLLGAVVLIERRWRVRTRIADVAISAILILFLSRLWLKADTLLPSEADLLDAGWPANQAASFAEVNEDVLSTLLWWLLLAGLLAALWVSVAKVIAAVRTAQRPEDAVPLVSSDRF